MPTTIRLSAVQPRIGFAPQLPSVTIFLVIALLQLTVAVFTGSQWASFGEQSLWW